MHQKFGKKNLKSPGTALEIGANFVCAFASKSIKAALLTLPDVINFYIIGNRLYLGNIV